MIATRQSPARAPTSLLDMPCEVLAAVVARTATLRDQAHAEETCRALLNASHASKSLWWRLWMRRFSCEGSLRPHLAAVIAQTALCREVPPDCMKMVAAVFATVYDHADKHGKESCADARFFAAAGLSPRWTYEAYARVYHVMLAEHSTSSDGDASNGSSRATPVVVFGALPQKPFVGTVVYWSATADSCACRPIWVARGRFSPKARGSSGIDAMDASSSKRRHQASVNVRVYLSGPGTMRPLVLRQPHEVPICHSGRDAISTTPCWQNARGLWHEGFMHAPV